MIGRKEGRKKGRKEGRKGKGRTEGRKDGRTEGRKDGRTEGRKDGRTEGRKDGTTEERKEGKKEGRKGVKGERQAGRNDGRKEGKKVGRKKMRKEGRGTDRQERRKEGREKGRKGENEDGIRQCRTIRLLLQVIPKLRRGPKWQGKTETSEGRAWGAWKRRGEEVQVGPSLNLTYHLFLVRSDVKQGKKKHYFRKRRWFFIGQTKTGEYQVNRVRVGYRQPPHGRWQVPCGLL